MYVARYLFIPALSWNVDWLEIILFNRDLDSVDRAREN